ncbi:DNA-directed RNA polymerase subunit beta, partial [Anaerolineae bacterium CFX7]|nr:DNA-directed RNA polymerase subunit beta [Anaerolineae bacterium CFX7]
MAQTMMMPVANGLRADQKTYARIPDVIAIPTLIQVQLESFKWFKQEGLIELFEEISPIESFNHNYALYFPGVAAEAKGLHLKYSFGEPKYSEAECREMDMTFARPLEVEVALVGAEVKEPIIQKIYMGDFPEMTQHGTFVINGAERVVVSQLIRSPGVYFTADEDRQTGRPLTSAKLIPNRGAWLEFETSKRDILSVKVDRKRKIPVTMLLRAVGVGGGTDEGILSVFAGVDSNPDHQFIRTTLERETPKLQGVNDSLIEFYKRLRPGDPATLDNAKSFMAQLLFTQRRYDLGKVG